MCGVAESLEMLDFYLDPGYVAIHMASCGSRLQKGLKMYEFWVNSSYVAICMTDCCSCPLTICPTHCVVRILGYYFGY